MTSKICSKCGQEKELDLFGIHRQSPDGHMAECKECHNQRSRDKYIEDIDESRRKGRECYHRHPKPRKPKRPSKGKKVCDQEYYEKNKDEILLYQKEYAGTHKKEIAEYKIQWYLENKEEIRAYKHQYYLDHMEQEKQRSKNHALNNKGKVNQRSREKNKDPQNRIAHNLRSRIGAVISGRSKGGRLHTLLGCSMEYFLKHIESQFVEGMNWSNYGKKDNQWSLDHIIPLALFTLENEEQQKCAFHWSNMRPLWHSDNCSKCNSFEGKRYYRKAS